MGKIFGVDMPAATVPLTGAETISVMQGGVLSDCTVQDIADLSSGGGGSSGDFEIITQASAFTAVPATHKGRGRLILAGGNVTFNTEGVAAGQCYNIRSTGALSLVGSGITLTPTVGGTLSMTANMQVTVVMTSGTTGIVMGLTVAP